MDMLEIEQRRHSYEIYLSANIILKVHYDVDEFFIEIIQVITSPPPPPPQAQQNSFDIEKILHFDYHTFLNVVDRVKCLFNPNIAFPTMMRNNNNSNYKIFIDNNDNIISIMDVNTDNHILLNFDAICQLIRFTDMRFDFPNKYDTKTYI